MCVLSKTTAYGGSRKPETGVQSKFEAPFHNKHTHEQTCFLRRAPI